MDLDLVNKINSENSKKNNIIKLPRDMKRFHNKEYMKGKLSTRKDVH